MATMVNVAATDTSLFDFAASVWVEAIWFLLGFLVIRAGCFSWLLPSKRQRVKRGTKPRNSQSNSNCLVKDRTRGQNQAHGASEQEHVRSVLQVACRSGNNEEVLRAIENFDAQVEVPLHDISFLLKYCLECPSRDPRLEHKVELLAQDSKLPLSRTVYESLLKLRVRSGAAGGCELFAEMLQRGFHPTEGYCGGILSRCAESANFSLAEAVARYATDAQIASLTLYKTLMKVYACRDLFDRACDVYEEVLKAGIEPDGVMCACVIRFALKCGRTELCWDALEKAPSFDNHQHLSVMRALAQDSNSSRILACFKRLRELRPETVDVAVYNCVLEICVKNGDLAEASELFREMRCEAEPDAKTYSILLRGHCGARNLTIARQLLEEMEMAGHAPSVACYNLVLAAMVAHGGYDEALRTISHMDHKGIALDNYSLSIMMKAAKQVSHPRDVERIMALIDRQRAGLIGDPVLLNSVLDSCVYHQDVVRLAEVVDAFSASGLSASVQTYGLLIRACGCLGRTRQCQELWEEMERCDIEPTSLTLGCMIDALVKANLLDEAVMLDKRYRSIVPLNAVIFSTLIKGCANAGQGHRAVELYREVRAADLSMNLVSYTALINSQARGGDPAVVVELLAQMKKEGCEPNLICYSAIIKGYCYTGRMDLALEILREMTERGLAFDVVVFNTLLDGCVRHSHFELADQLLLDMRRHKIAASTFTLSIVVKLCGKRRDLDRAFREVRAMPKEHGFAADAKVGTCLLGACFANNSPHQAMEAFKELQRWPKSRKFNGPDEQCYNTLIQGLARCGRLVDAVHFVEEACGLHDQPGAGGANNRLGAQSLSALIRDLSSRSADGQLVMALKSKLRSARIRF